MLLLLEDCGGPLVDVCPLELPEPDAPEVPPDVEPPEDVLPPALAAHLPSTQNPERQSLSSLQAAAGHGRNGS